MRWLSTASWLAAAISESGAFCCTLSEATASATSSISSARARTSPSAAPMPVSTCCCPMIAFALSLSRVTSCETLSRSPAKRSPKARIVLPPTPCPPSRRLVTMPESAPALSPSSWNAASPPAHDWMADLAMRCACACAWSTTSSCPDVLPDWVTTQNTPAPAINTASMSTKSSLRRCPSTVSVPRTGKVTVGSSLAGCAYDASRCELICESSDEVIRELSPASTALCSSDSSSTPTSCSSSGSLLKMSVSLSAIFSLWRFKRRLR